MRNLDIRKFNQAIVVLLVVGALLIGILKGHSLANQYVAFGIPILLIGFMLIGNLELLWCFLVMISGSNLAAGNTTLYSLLAFAYSGAGLLVVLMRKDDGTPMQAHHKFLIGLLIVSIILPAVRGLGIKALGSTTWGGIQYFTLWGGLGICLFSNRMHVSKKKLIRAIIVMLIIGSVPGLLRYINEVSGGRLNALGRLINGVAVEMMDVTGNAENKRLEGIQQSGISLILLSMAIMDWRKHRIGLILAVFFLGVIILGLAGYRSSVILAIMTIGFYYLLMKHEIPKKVKRATVITGFVVLFSLPFLLPYLPFGFQRMFAWVPGVNISEAAYQSAQGTTEWRVDMWIKVLPMVKDYWLIGRGLTYELFAAYGAFTLTSDMGTMHEFFIATHQYHNGPLYLLIDYGVPGLIFGAGFMVSSVHRHWKIARGHWHDIRVRNLHAVFLAHHLANVIKFWFIFGALTGMMVMFLEVLLMEMLYKANKLEAGVE